MPVALLRIRRGGSGTTIGCTSVVLPNAFPLARLHASLTSQLGPSCTGSRSIGRCISRRSRRTAPVAGVTSTAYAGRSLCCRVSGNGVGCNILIIESSSVVLRALFTTPLRLLLCLLEIRLAIQALGWCDAYLRLPPLSLLFDRPGQHLSQVLGILDVPQHIPAEQDTRGHGQERTTQTAYHTPSQLGNHPRWRLASRQQNPCARSTQQPTGVLGRVDIALDGPECCELSLCQLLFRLCTGETWKPGGAVVDIAARRVQAEAGRI